MAKVKKGFRFKGIIAILFVFAAISFVLFVELSGIRANYSRKALDPLPKEKIITKEEALKASPRKTLVIYNFEDEASLDAKEEFDTILLDMRIGYDEVDVSKTELPLFENYENAVLLISNLDVLGEKVIELCDFVEEGGNVLFALTLQKSSALSIIESKLGILESSWDNAEVSKLFVSDEFMIGGGKSFTIDDPFDSALSVNLDYGKAKVYMHTDGEKKIPLVWKTNYGKGSFVVDNFGLYDKVFRGFFASSLSLLGDVFIYPVINGSTFYLDDFPSQIPEGSNEYINRDYNTTTTDFYTNIWWPDMMNIADNYGLKFTGLAIESYDDNVDGTTSALPDTATFSTFGNMLLRQGGELGYHGYNHQPLCLGNCDYEGMFDYKTWDNYGAMRLGFNHLVSLCDRLFPDADMSVYVPPSNIFSTEGREFLLSEYPQIKTVSGIYFPDSASKHSWVQEFKSYPDGAVDQPRVISGCNIDSFMELALISEINLHFLNNHFTHPDDALDPDRGAELGWEELKKRFNSYLSYLYTSAKGIRSFTGSEMSAAVQRFTSVTPITKISDDKITIDIKGFYDEASFLVRLGEKEPDRVSGGELIHQTGDIYLLNATERKVTITLKK